MPISKRGNASSKEMPGHKLGHKSELEKDGFICVKLSGPVGCIVSK